MCALKSLYACSQGIGKVFQKIGKAQSFFPKIIGDFSKVVLFPHATDPVGAQSYHVLYVDARFKVVSIMVPSGK